VEKTVNINKNPVLVTTNITIKNRSIGGIHVDGISFSILQNGKTILSDEIGSPRERCATNYIGCVSYGIEGLADYQIIRESKAEAGKVDLNNSKYSINGTLNYKHDDSNKLLSTQFLLDYP
jgi:hypothetical protein